MKLYKIMSYKTFYYFLKDHSNLLMTGYKVTPADIDISKLSQQKFYDIFNASMLGTNDIVEIRTNKGSLVYHKIDDIEYVQEFLKRNSKKAPCGVFGNYRTSNVYMLGIANNGELKRFFYSEGGESILKGKITDCEKNTGLKLQVGANGILQTNIDEEDIFNCAKDFVGFDIEQEDVEILGIYYYELDLSESEEKVLPHIDLPEDIVTKIHRNLFKQSLENISLLLIKNESSDNLYFLSYSENEREEDFILFNEIIPNYKDKDRFINALSHCMDIWSKCDFNEGKEIDANFEKTITSFKLGKKVNVLILMVSNNKLNTVTISQNRKKGKQLGKLRTLLSGIKNYEEFKPSNLEDIYKFSVKCLK